MRFHLEVDLDALGGEPVRELQRILRYWGGVLTPDLLVPDRPQDLYDSTYTRVGAWEVTDAV